MPAMVKTTIDSLKVAKLLDANIVTPIMATEEITTSKEVVPVTINKIVTEETPLKTEVKRDKKIKEELE
ncbi:hypothetical protein [Flavobacterium sp. GSP6]|uniref:hypothetical protein n=1 Tax=Flavobacterium sp. GSP6 TaxID=2497488 RepID=UPI000F874193|nr:hypothetical protein [Flavobacterium sp. GSP6]RTZ03256.1 hypothetical protein EKM03_13360 [Flavobacterium sp. GSP6]